MMCARSWHDDFKCCRDHSSRAPEQVLSTHCSDEARQLTASDSNWSRNWCKHRWCGCPADATVVQLYLKLVKGKTKGKTKGFTEAAVMGNAASAHRSTALLLACSCGRCTPEPVLCYWMQQRERTGSCGQANLSSPLCTLSTSTLRRLNLDCLISFC